MAEVTGESPRFGGRLIIILFASGIVILGLAPLSRKHGGISNFVKSAVSELFEHTEALAKNTYDAVRNAQRKPGVTPGAQGRLATEQNLDQTSEKDKRALDDLINRKLK